MEGGDSKLDLKIMLMTIIALTALLGGQGFIMNLLLEPVKQSQIRMEKQMGKMESRMGKMESRMGKMDSRMDKIESRMNTLESKVDQVLLQKNLVQN